MENSGRLCSSSAVVQSSKRVFRAGRRFECAHAAADWDGDGEKKVVNGLAVKERQKW